MREQYYLYVGFASWLWLNVNPMYFLCLTAFQMWLEKLVNYNGNRGSHLSRTTYFFFGVLRELLRNTLSQVNGDESRSVLRQVLDENVV